MRDLATKYRPRKWSEVVGQKHVVDVLKSKKDWKALFFQGPPGTGKTTVARLVAMHVNCDDPDGIDACGGQCKYCEMILQKGFLVDYREENVGDARGIDDIRALVEWLQYRPIFLRKKVVVLDEVHNLTKPAQNLLLKVVEEPPESVVFIMCTTSPYGVIEPLRQRCQVFVFKPVSDLDMIELFVRVVSGEGVDGDRFRDEQIKELLRKAGGVPRRFLMLLEYVLYGGQVEVIDEAERRLGNVIDYVLKGDVLGLVKIYPGLLGEVEVRDIVPMVCAVLMKRIKQSDAYFDVVRYLTVLKSMETTPLLYTMAEEDRVLYQLLNAAVTMKSFLRQG